MFPRISNIFMKIVVLVMIVYEVVGWTRHDEIRTGQQVMYTSASTFYNSSQTPISYWIIYNQVITTPRSAGIGIVGFNTLITNDFCVNTTIQNFTLGSLRVTAKVYSDTLLTFLSINWIVIGNSADFVEILMNCYLCNILNTGKGDRTQNITGTTLFVGYVNLAVNVYLSGFQLHNSQGLINYLSADATISTGTNIIKYSFFTNENNTVTQICFTTIIFNQIVTKYLYYDWGQVGNVQLSNVTGVGPSAFPFPTNGIDYTEQNRMFFGMGAFNLSRATRRVFYLNTDNYDSLTTDYTNNYGTYSVRVDFFWLAVRNCNNSHPWFDIYDMDCDNNCNHVGGGASRYQTNPGSFCARCHYTCLTCDAAHATNCTDCNYTLFRHEDDQSGGGGGGGSGGQTSCPCNQTYIDIGIALCYPCQSFIPGCRQCNSVSSCFQCLPGFNLLSNGLCSCTLGYLVSGICVNIAGCTSATQYGGNTYCLQCNSTLNYVMSNYTCVCMTGFYSISNFQCLPTCGDARQVSTEGCDDGNLINGDGCSSACKVQSKWICQGGTPTSKSTCYIYDNITMAVKWVKRITSMNRMQVGIRFSPFYSKLTQTNFKKYLVHTVPCTDYNATFTNGTLILQFDYNRTIEGQFFDITLNLDPSIFYSTVITTQIPASGMNGKLTYDTLNQINSPFEIIVIILDVLAVIVLFASCVSERMIGIEMIQTIQTVLYAQAVMKTTPSSLTPLQMLRYSSGYNQVQGLDPARTFTFAFSLSSLGLQKQFLLSYNLMYVILVIVIILCLILKLKQYYHMKKIGTYVQDEEQAKNQRKLSTTTTVYHFIFERILFLVAFMCMFLIVFALMLQLTDMSSDYILVSKELNLLCSIIAIAILGTMICGVILNGCFPAILLFPMLMKQYYPPTYFIYQSAFIFLLAFDYTQQYILYVLAGMSFIFMVYNAAYRPYVQKFHTFVLIFHQIIIMGVIGVYVYENLTKPAENQALYKILNGVIILVLYIVVFLNAYRLYRYRRFMQQHGWDQYGNPDFMNTYQDTYDSIYKDVYPDSRKLQNDGKNRNNQILKSRAKQAEVQPARKLKNKQSAITSKPKEQSPMNWKYNKLAEGQNNPRYDATKRENKQDTARDRDNGTFKKTNDNLRNTRNKDDNDNDHDDSYTVKGGKYNQPQNKAKQYDDYDNGNINDEDYNDRNANNDNDNVFDNPYDENGFAKRRNQNASNVQDDDPLQAIKKRLKNQFSTKVKASTLKQQ